MWASGKVCMGMSSRLRGVKAVLPMPTQASGVGVEARGRDNLLAVAGGDELGGRFVLQFANAPADAQRQVVLDGEKTAVEQAVEGGRHAHAVGRVGASVFVNAPRNNVPGDEALHDREAGDAAAVVVTADDGIAEECLVQSLLDGNDLFRRAGVRNRGIRLPLARQELPPQVASDPDPPVPVVVTLGPDGLE